MAIYLYTLYQLVEIFGKNWGGALFRRVPVKEAYEVSKRLLKYTCESLPSVGISNCKLPEVIFTMPLHGHHGL